MFRRLDTQGRLVTGGSERSTLRGCSEHACAPARARIHTPNPPQPLLLSQVPSPDPRSAHEKHPQRENTPALSLRGGFYPATKKSASNKMMRTPLGLDGPRGASSQGHGPHGAFPHGSRGTIRSGPRSILPALGNLEHPDSRVAAAVDHRLYAPDVLPILEAMEEMTEGPTVRGPKRPRAYNLIKPMTLMYSGSEGTKT